MIAFERHDPRPTICGMRVTPAFIKWRDEKRKWRRYLSEGGGGADDFIAEDRDRLPVRPRGFFMSCT